MKTYDERGIFRIIAAMGKDKRRAIPAKNSPLKLILLF